MPALGALRLLAAPAAANSTLRAPRLSRPSSICSARSVATRQRAYLAMAAADGGALEVTFSRVSGVVKTRVGYTGGSTPAPTYASVCANDGHTEAIQITFDRTVTSYEKILDVFFSEHNPSVRSRKAQYKSAIWFHSPQQEQAARAAIASLEARFGKIHTDLAPAAPWWDAEEYHQQFYFKQKAKRG